jgi:DNA-binding HxlR family transcriptional regulator
MSKLQFWKITHHGTIILHLTQNESARLNDLARLLSIDHHLLKQTLDDLHSFNLVDSEYRDTPIGENYFLTTNGKHIANVLLHSVEPSLIKAEKSIAHLMG